MRYHLWFWDSQMTISDLKPTHRPCGWLLVKSLGQTFFHVPWACFMWRLTDILLNTEDENWTQSIHTFMINLYLYEVIPENIKVTRDFYFWSKLNQKQKFYEVTYHHTQSSWRQLKSWLLRFMCSSWIKFEFHWIFNVKNDHFVEVSVSLKCGSQYVYVCVGGDHYKFARE